MLAWTVSEFVRSSMSFSTWLFCGFGRFELNQERCLLVPRVSMRVEEQQLFDRWNYDGYCTDRLAYPHRLAKRTLAVAVGNVSNASLPSLAGDSSAWAHAVLASRTVALVSNRRLLRDCCNDVSVLWLREWSTKNHWLAPQEGHDVARPRIKADRRTLSESKRRSLTEYSMVVVV